MDRFDRWLRDFQGPLEAPMDYTPAEESWWLQAGRDARSRGVKLTAAALGIGCGLGWIISAIRNPSEAFIINEFDVALVVVVSIFLLIGSATMSGSKKREMVRSRRLMAAMREADANPPGGGNPTNQ